MKAQDLNLLELLELKPDEGSIQFKNRRMLLWDADAFGHLRRELIESMGVERARPVLKRFGFANGYRDARTTGELFNWDDDIQWWLSCPALQRHEGKVRAMPQQLVVDRANGRFEMEVIWHHSYEAVQHSRMFGRSNKPICWTLTGFASGFSTALMGEEVYVIEEECAAMGGDRCRVVGKTRTAWGDEGAVIAADYEAQNLSVELEAREADLRRHQRTIKRRERELADLRGARVSTRGGIVIQSRTMENVLDLAQAVAKVDATVLIRGESGVGKELLARYIHDESPRADKAFIAINCGALPETLLESELFGHIKGAFTGADSNRRGLCDAARGGTIFLDEIGETSMTTQVKLLRVLQEHKMHAVGAHEEHPIDVRVLVATSHNLEEMVEHGRFRKDLYYQLNVVSVEIPPLRSRREDILPLARDFLMTACQTHQLQPRTLSPEAVNALTEYHWPGNVRELQNAIERAVVLSGDASKVGIGDLPKEVREGNNTQRGIVVYEVLSMAELERRYVLQVLERFGGNRTHTAKALGIGTNTLWRKLKSWGIPPAHDASN